MSVFVKMKKLDSWLKMPEIHGRYENKVVYIALVTELKQKRKRHFTDLTFDYEEREVKYA